MELIVSGPDAPAQVRARLDALLSAVFGLSLAGWHEAGGWTGAYICYSLADGDRIVSNVSVYTMDLLVRGAPVRCRQIGAVATSPDWRGKGLSRRILEAIFAEDPLTPYMLFANASVIDFYPRFGFRRAADHAPLLALDEPLGFGEMLPTPVDDPRVRQYLERRAAYSQVLDVSAAAPLGLFHLLYEYPANIFKLPRLDALVVAEQTGSRLDVVDVIATRPLTWEELRPQLGFYGARTVRFGFNPDWLGIWAAPEVEETSLFFVRGPLDLPSGAIIPWMART